MLRVTRYVHAPSITTLKVEGRIVEDWVIVLKQAVDAALQSEQRLELDFTDIGFIDEAGINMLRDLPRDNLSIVHCPHFIQTLLDQKPTRE